MRDALPRYTLIDFSGRAAPNSSFWLERADYYYGDAGTPAVTLSNAALRGGSSRRFFPRLDKAESAVPSRRNGSKEVDRSSLSSEMCSQTRLTAVASPFVPSFSLVCPWKTDGKSPTEISRSVRFACVYAPSLFLPLRLSLPFSRPPSPSFSCLFPSRPTLSFPLSHPFSSPPSLFLFLPLSLPPNIHLA